MVLFHYVLLRKAILLVHLCHLCYINWNWSSTNKKNIITLKRDCGDGTKYMIICIYFFQAFKYVNCTWNITCLVVPHRRTDTHMPDRYTYYMCTDHTHIYTQDRQTDRQTHILVLRSQTAIFSFTLRREWGAATLLNMLAPCATKIKF